MATIDKMDRNALVQMVLKSKSTEKALLKKLTEFEAGGKGLEERNSKLSGQLLQERERRSLAEEEAERLRVSPGGEKLSASQQQAQVPRPQETVSAAMLERPLRLIGELEQLQRKKGGYASTERQLRSIMARARQERDPSGLLALMSHAHGVVETCLRNMSLEEGVFALNYCLPSTTVCPQLLAALNYWLPSTVCPQLFAS